MIFTYVIAALHRWQENKETENSKKQLEEAIRDLERAHEDPMRSHVTFPEPSKQGRPLEGCGWISQEPLVSRGLMQPSQSLLRLGVGNSGVFLALCNFCLCT